MPGGNFHRSPGDRGGGRKRPPSLMRGGPALKAPRFDNGPPRRGGSGGPPRGRSGRGSSRGRSSNPNNHRGGGFSRGRGQSSSSYDSRRDYVSGGHQRVSPSPNRHHHHHQQQQQQQHRLSSPHRRERRPSPPPPPSLSSSASYQDRRPSYPSSSQHDSTRREGYESGRANQGEAARRERFSPTTGWRNNRDQFSPSVRRNSRDRASPAARRSSRDRSPNRRNSRERFSPINQRNRFSPQNRRRSRERSPPAPSPTSRERSPLARPRSRDRGVSPPSRTEDVRGRERELNTRASPIPTSSSSSSSSRPPMKASSANVEPRSSVCGRDPSSEPTRHESGPAKPTLSTSLTRRSQSPSPSPSRRRQISELTETERKSRSPDSSFASSDSRGGRGPNAVNAVGRGNYDVDTSQHRESALNRLGPKMKVKQRLGKNFTSPHAISKHADGTSMDTMGSSLADAADGSGSGADADSAIAGPSDVSDSPKKKLIKIQCPHCDIKTVMFKDYAKHFRLPAHQIAMQKLTKRIRLTLVRMRSEQRAEQREIEDRLAAEGKDVDPDGNKLPSLFCELCKLMFHQDVNEHNRSDLHKRMQQFLNPSCSLCNTKFYSPISYEKHIATLNHIKKKSEFIQSNRDEFASERKKEDSDGNHAGGHDNDDLDDHGIDFNQDFVTLDEIGDDDNDPEDGDEGDQHEDADGEDDNNEDQSSTATYKVVSSPLKDSSGKMEETQKNSTTPNNDVKLGHDGDVKPLVKADQLDKVVIKSGQKIKSEPSTSPQMKSPIKMFKVDPSEPVGQNYIRKVEMFFCEICHKYLPRNTSTNPDSAETLLKQHCLMQSHQAAYAKKRQEEIDEEERALNAIQKDEPEDSDTLIIHATKIEDDEDQLDYEN